MSKTIPAEEVWEDILELIAIDDKQRREISEGLVKHARDLHAALQRFLPNLQKTNPSAASVASAILWSEIEWLEKFSLQILPSTPRILPEIFPVQ